MVAALGTGTRDESWYKSGLSSRPFGVPVSNRFGIFRKTDGAEFSYEVSHRNSTSLAAMAVEITRQTSRSDWPLRKAEELAHSHRPEVGIEILCCQLLVFLDEFDYWQRRDRYSALLRLLWDSDEDAPITALAGLCLGLVEDPIRRELWEVCRELIKSEYLKTVDARIATIVLRIGGSGLADTPNDLRSEQASQPERYNAILLNTGRTFTHSLVQLVCLVGATGSPAHRSALRTHLIDMGNNLNLNDPRKTHTEAKQIRPLIEMLIIALRNLHTDEYVSSSPGLPHLEQDANNLESMVTQLPSRRVEDEADQRYFEEMHLWINHVSSLIFGNGTGQDCIASNYWRSFFITIEADRPIAGLLDALRARIEADWHGMVADKLRSHERVESRWVEDGVPKPVVPCIRCSDPGRWGGANTVVYVDAQVNECIVDCLSNCIHATDMIRNLWNRGQPTQDVADLWWHAELNNDFLTVEFHNACSTEEINLKRSHPAIAALESVCGSITARVQHFAIEQNGDARSIHIAETTLKIPTLTTILKI